MTRGTILLVGRRKAATTAVRRLGFEPAELYERPRALQAVGAFGGTPEAAIASAQALLGDGTPAAVLAVAEGSVPAAAAVRAHYGLPGLSQAASALCHDKLAMKRTAHAAGIPCARWLAVTEQTTTDEIVDRLGLPVVLKVPVSSGSRGVRIARTADEVALAAQPGMLAESFVQGVEMSVESLLLGGATLFRNPTRYLVPRWANVVPAALDRPVHAAVAALVDRVHATLGVDTGITHCELFLTADGPVFGEIAARPPGGLLMELIELAYGFDPWVALVRIALGQRPALPRASSRCAGVYFLHPGAGRLTAIDGVQATRAMPGVVRLDLAVEPGDEIPPRIGTGQSIGHVVAVAPDPVACASVLTAAHRRIDFALEPRRDQPAGIEHPPRDD